MQKSFTTSLQTSAEGTRHLFERPLGTGSLSFVGISGGPGFFDSGDNDHPVSNNEDIFAKMPWDDFDRGKILMKKKGSLDRAGSPDKEDEIEKTLEKYGKFWIPKDQIVKDTSPPVIDI